MKVVQLHIPMYIPTLAEQRCQKIMEQMEREDPIPDGSIVRTKMIYIKNLLK